jgi:hypothetical protein
LEIIHIIIQISINVKQIENWIIYLYVIIIKKDSQFVLWFQLSKTVLKLDSDLVFGCVYIPPENSKYSSSDTFDEIENELISIINVDKRYIALTYRGTNSSISKLVMRLKRFELKIR